MKKKNNEILKKTLIILSFAYFYLFIVSVYPTDYSTTLPGDTKATEEIFKIENHNVFSMDTIFVITYSPLTYLQKSIIEFISNDNISKTNDFNKENNNIEKYKIGQIQKQNSFNKSAILAYKKANKFIDYSFHGYVNLSNSSNDIKVGDIIRTINDIELVEGIDFQQFQSINIYKIELIRKNKMVRLEYQNQNPDIKLYLDSYYEINSSIPAISLSNELDFIGGPSGGLITALSIYASLKQLVLEYKISGTGVISLNGEVKPVGGLIQKYYTAYFNSDFFMIPSSQLEIFNSVENSKIIPISNFDEAINFLENLK
jgi:PDZ domain-containing secreted protein